MSEKKVRIGIIGYGGIGSAHCSTLAGNVVPNMELVAICDIDPERIELAKKNHPSLKYFLSADELLKDPDIDAVHICVPHYDHPTLAIKSLAAGKHTMIEKPAGVYGKQVIEMNEFAAKCDKKFGIMLNMRVNPVFIKLRNMIQSGMLGAIKRVTWTVTTWYRPQPYHVRNNWCSTWEGEGGGTLINQNPHNIDMWQWLFGMPDTITSFCKFGKYYDIDVEDEVVAHFDYKNGMTGVYITSTGEFPGTNILDIACDMGSVRIENYKDMTFLRNEISEREYNANNAGCFGGPDYWKCEIPVDSSKNKVHAGIFEDFARSILEGTPLLAPGEEGLSMVTMANAMHYSTWIGNRPVSLEDFPHDKYLELLQEKVKNSKYPMRSGKAADIDFEGTYAK